MMLFVDDIRNSPDEKKWITARTNEAACAAILQFRPEVISIDHDISHQVQLEKLSRPFPCNDTFTPVVYFLAALYADHPVTQHPRIILHTSNPVGAAKMQQILARFDIECEIKHYGPANRLEMTI